MDFMRYEAQNNLIVDYLKFKHEICRKHEVLLSSLVSNVVCDIAVSLQISSYDQISGQKLTPLGFSRKQF